MEDTKTKQKLEDTWGGIRWDDLNIEKCANHFPEELREDFRWLKSWVRDCCHRDLDILLERAKALGIYHDKTTWSRVLRGRSHIDNSGEPLKTPVISSEKLRSAIEALRSNVRAEALRGKVPFVETTSWEAIESYIDGKRARDRVNRWGVVVGPTGSQKTACFKEYVRRNNHGATWWMEAPAGGGVSEFLGRLGMRAGLAEQTSRDKKRFHLLRTIPSGKAIIIDNVQDLYRPGRLEQPVFSFLRQLQDETECCIILSITPTFERELTNGMMLGYFEQFEGRSGGRRNWLRLPDYAPDEDVVRIAEAFQLQAPRQHLKKLVEISREPGRVRRVFEDLQQARILANASKQALTIDHLLEARGED